MRACLLEQRTSNPDKELYDLRYFYFDKERVGHSSCGMAIQTLIPIHRKHFERIGRGDWYLAISDSNNPA